MKHALLWSSNVQGGGKRRGAFTRRAFAPLRDAILDRLDTNRASHHETAFCQAIQGDADAQFANIATALASAH
jgi:hypothetical protein